MIISVHITEPSYPADQFVAGALRMFAYGFWLDYTTSIPIIEDVEEYIDRVSNAVHTEDPRLSDARNPLTHPHVTADVTSGQFAMERLASGTPDGTKFIRDDGILVTPTAGAAETNPSVHVTTADYNLLANRSLVFAGEYEIGNGFTTDIANGAILEV